MLDAAPASGVPAGPVRLQAADDALDRVAAGEQGRGHPVGLVADQLELVVLGVDDVAALVQHEGVGDQGLGVLVRSSSPAMVRPPGALGSGIQA